MNPYFGMSSTNTAKNVDKNRFCHIFATLNDMHCLRGRTVPCHAEVPGSIILQAEMFFIAYIYFSRVFGLFMLSSAGLSKKKL